MNERDCLYWALAYQAQARIWAAATAQELDQYHAAPPGATARGRRMMTIRAQEAAAHYARKAREMLAERKQLLTLGAP